MELKRVRTYITALSIATLLLTFQGYAQVVGRYSGEFMAMGAGSKTLAMGGAAVATANDPWALFYNPAGLASIDNRQFGFMHAEQFEGVVDFDAAVFAMPNEQGRTLTVGLLRLGVNGIPFTELEDPNQPLGDANRIEVREYVTDGEYALFLAQAGRIAQSPKWLGVKDLEWGVAPKLIFKHIGNYRHYGIGLDAGLTKRWQGYPAFAVGFSGRDLLGTLIKSEKTGRSEVIVTTFRLGGEMTLPLSALEADLSFLADGIYRTESLGESEAAEYRAGVEYLVRKAFALRTGSDNGRLTFGGGISFNPISLDYAFAGHDDLGDTHRISLTVRWGRN